MLWACVLLPQLALDGVMRRRENPEEPLALISGTAQRRVLQTVNPAARTIGLRAGQSLTAAHAVNSPRSNTTRTKPSAGIVCWRPGPTVSVPTSASSTRACC
jgi:protein ImuB